MEKIKKQTKKKIHYAWWILIACCLINASALGITNSNGLFFPEICAELGVSISELCVHSIVYGLSSAAALFAVDKAYAKLNARMLIIVSLLVYHASYMVMYFFHSVAAFCIASAFTGIASAFLLYIPVPMLINNWFVKSKKTALSICFVASGLSGIRTSLMLGWTIPAFGWRLSYVIRACFGLLLAVPVMFIVKKTPAEAGCRPYGADEEAEKCPDGSHGAAEKKKQEKVYGESAEHHSRKELRIKLIFTVFLAVSFNFSCSLTGQLANFASSINLSVAMGSVLTSLAMVGNISSKAAFGPLTEKTGVAKVTVGILFLTMTGWLLAGMGITQMPVICFMSIVTGMTACVNTLVVPNLADTFANGDAYVHVLARCSTGTMLASAFGTSITSALFDLFGSYTPVFLIFAVLEVLNITVVLLVFGRKRKS